jgi:hypothetical protein
MKIAGIRAFFLCIVFTSLQSWGQVVLISDIDDTLKVSMVLDTISAIDNATSTESFWQMPELVQALQPQLSEIYYLSNAPQELMEDYHRNFLVTNKYPNGYLVLPPLGEGTGHKIRWIQKIITEKKPKTVIFLGDNGEQDIAIYHSAFEQFKNSGIEFLTFIRIDYDPAVADELLPYPEQKTFVTAGEVALYLSSRNLLSSQSALSLVKSSSVRPGFNWWWKQQLHSGASIGLPDWIDCKTHWVNLQSFYNLSPLVQTLEAKVKDRCSYVISPTLVRVKIQKRLKSQL